MSRQTEFTCVVLDRHTRFSFSEMCHACDASKDVVIEMVHEGVIDAKGAEPDDWQFHGEELVRARRALRLVRDLRVNWPGAALALDLMDQLERLRSE